MKWKLISEKNVHNGWRKVDKRRYLLPNGKEDDFEIKIENDTAAIFALTHNNNVIIAEQYRPGPDKVMLDLPGGTVEKGDSPLQTAKKELLEETGYSGDFIELPANYQDAFSTRKSHHFLAINCTKIQEPELEDTEFINVKLIPLDEFIKIMASSEITDLLTLYLALEQLKKL